VLFARSSPRRHSQCCLLSLPRTLAVPPNPEAVVTAELRPTDTDRNQTAQGFPEAVS